MVMLTFSVMEGLLSAFQVLLAQVRQDGRGCPRHVIRSVIGSELCNSAALAVAEAYGRRVMLPVLKEKLEALGTSA